MTHEHYTPDNAQVPPRAAEFDSSERRLALPPVVEQLGAATAEEIHTAAIDLGTRVESLRGAILGGAVPDIPDLDTPVQDYLRTLAGQRALFNWFATRTTLLDAVSDNLADIVNPDNPTSVEDLLEFARVCDRILERCRTAMTRRYLNAGELL